MTLRNLIRIGGAFTIIFGLVFYMLFQARLLIAGPHVTLINPPNMIQTERLVELSGYAKNITHMTLNGRAIFTNTEGYFSEALVLDNGYNTVTIRAEDRYGRIAETSHPFVYTPKEDPELSTVTNNNVWH